MNKKEILEVFKGLAAHQEYFRLLYESLISGDKMAEELLDKMEKEKFTNVTDMVMWLEY